jgi:xanthine dehydrogenase YagS FAD-binding subunit
VIPFDYRRADDAAGAVATVTGSPGAAYLAGGTNLVDHLKLDIARPDLLVDVTGLPFDRVEPRADGGLRVGATVRNSDLAADPVVRERYPVLSQALLAGASGQLRNMATTGGNLLQRTRCSYFQDVTTPCNKREPGSGCSALEGYHRYHAILGASPDCVAVHPSDMAVALVALDATVRVLGRDGERDLPVADLHRLPDGEPERDTVLEHGDLITAVDLPAPLSTRSAYRKVRERSSYAFALVSVAAVVDLRDGRIRDSRIAFGGVAHKPWRAHAAEAVLRDAEPSEQLFAHAADAELAGARPLPDNGFKIAMARGALAATLRALTEEATA